MEALAEETDASTTLVINDPGTVTKPAGAPSFKRAFRGQATLEKLYYQLEFSKYLVFD